MSEQQFEVIGPREAVLLGAESLTTFGHVFFPKTFRQASPEMHEEIGRRLYAPVRKNLILVFRDGAKTTLLRVFTAQRAAYAISRTIMFVSVSQDHSIHSIRWLKKAVEKNHNFRETFRLKPGKKWTDEWIEIENEAAGVSINILAAGITGQIRGFNLEDFRPDLIVADDILSDENTKTQAQRQKIAELFDGALYNSLAAETEAPNAKIVLLQTPFHNDDLAMKASKDPSWHPAVFGILDENGESRWKEKFPTATVAAERDSSFLRGQKRLWMREKMCQVVKEEETLLNSEKLRYWTELPQGLVKFMAIDPASSDSKRADQNVVMAIGIKGAAVYVLAFAASRNTMPDRASQQFFDIATRFPPIVRAGVESIAYQRVLAWYIEREMAARGIYVPIDRIQDQRAKSDKILQHIPALLAYGNLYIHPSMTDLVQQMDEYDPNDDGVHDDILDALSMAIRTAGPVLKTPYTLEGEARVFDESDYPALETLGGCP